LKHNSGVIEMVVFAIHNFCKKIYFLTFGHSHTLTMIALTFTFEVHRPSSPWWSQSDGDHRPLPPCAA